MRQFLLVLIALLACSPLAWAGEKKAKPNILFIVSDDLNNDLGCYGHPLVKSPHIDALAKKGIRFDRAYCQYPVCNPSRASFMTSLYPTQTGVLNNAVNFRKNHPDVVTLAQLFMRAGYFSARVGKIYHYGVPLQIGTNGLDDAKSWNKVVNPIGIDRTELDKVHTLQKGQYGGTLSWLKIDSKDTDHTDGKAANEAIKLLEVLHPKKTNQPFFLAVGFYRPHTPFVAPSKYFDMYPLDKIHPVLEKPGDRDDIPPAALADRPKQRELTIEQRKEIIQAYYASISYMDAQVGRIMEALDKLGLRDNTIVVFVSDHGYHLGAHGLWQKGDLFESSCRVPLIICEPANPNNGKSTNAITEMLDIYPTLAELAGLGRPDHVKGDSLVPVLRDPSHKGKASALTVANSRGKGEKTLGYSIRTERYRYTEWGKDGKLGVELYDYQNDPEEYTNLAVIPQHAETVRMMKGLLAEAKKRSE
jgi:iduronate 2-sulfatase